MAWFIGSGPVTRQNIMVGAYEERECSPIGKQGHKGAVQEVDRDNSPQAYASLPVPSSL